MKYRRFYVQAHENGVLLEERTVGGEDIFGLYDKIGRVIFHLSTSFPQASINVKEWQPARMPLKHA